ncbi:MAG: DUF1569 domain-containing protein [Chitinophaga sp.]|uniref:DUF1569 domain-containing protein n=1 Tax=Chitinophaga sp. TaxID=1869181 RepID=UPI0025C611BB|nr:DUF1569 domain-containing protein [Chitinophaga sp.]MBV8252081.1 DUF1569 domain-containing protein [Chitinophaga sp.]
MKTILDKSTRDELANRINQLQESSTAQWGQMNVRQMLRHCILWEEMALGKKTYPRVFLGYIFGRLALRSLLKEKTLMPRNARTITPMKITEVVEADVETQKQQWLALMAEHVSAGTPEVHHPIFGKLTSDEVCILMYKHADHHLRQFNV